MSKVFGVLIGLMFLIGGIVELYLTGHFGRWLSKNASGSTSPFVLGSLGTGGVIAILLILMGIAGIIVTLGGYIDLSSF